MTERIQTTKRRVYDFLRWSEKYTKTDMIYLTKGGAWLTGGTIISSISTFLLAIAFANLLPKATYGTYKFVLSIVSILSIPTLSGINTAVTQAVARGYENTIKPAVRIRVRWGVLGALGSLSAAGYYFINSNVELTVAFLVAASFLPFMDTFTLFDAYLQGRKEFAVVSRYNVYIKIISVIVLGVSIFLTNNLFIILLSYFAPYTIMRYIFLRLSLIRIPPNNKTDESAIIYGKHLSLMGIIGTIANQLDKILLFHFLGAAPVAIYSIAVSPVEQLKGPLKNLNLLILPNFSERPENEIRRGIKSKMVRLLLVSAVMALLYILFAPSLFDLFFPQYFDAVAFSQVSAISLLTISVAPVNAFLVAKKRIKAQYIGSTLSPLFQIGVMIAFVISFGLWGIVIARVLHRFFAAILGLILYRTAL